ncbi:hypothetical protein GCK72_018882 [Caenorhabditis remanei]|uniref:Uncharacterized protein n=1 Tax=Caenorhabditis remanei TaxID=31234 RepID=A0A6A5GB21_CAERE|nr:hypothetical protein GCK72_018882 [Caenorhabditis remanei]KAF1752328.1 hypothetical protein GCK72_018882 [Caenorhabditis remanei]
MSKAPQPLFTFFGVDGGATCSCVHEDHLFVGSQKGVVNRYGLDSKINEQVVYDDEEDRRIQSVEYSKSHLFVHIRSFAVIQLKESEDSNGTWQIVKTVEVDHIGFCNSLILGPQLLFVSADPRRVPTLCWNNIEENKKNEYKCTQIQDKPDITPMCMIIGDKEENEVLIGMEDGQLSICYRDEEGAFKLQGLEPLGREPIFCIASSSKFVAAGCARSPIYLIEKVDLSKKEIHYPPDSAGCSAITFSPNEKQILAGFWDGTIRVFSRQRLNVLLALTSSHSATISSLHWLPPEKGELVIATSSDSTITMWKLK